jgi:hypothetical protein
MMRHLNHQEGEPEPEVINWARMPFLSGIRAATNYHFEQETSERPTCSQILVGRSTAIL